jgi:hypothetical protein
MLEWYGPAGGGSNAELAPPSTALDIAENITVAAYVRVIVEGIVINIVAPTSNEFPAGAVLTGNVAFLSTLPHGCFNIPCNDETITTACVENTLRGGATNELSGGVECK